MTARVPLPPQLGTAFSIREAASLGVGRGRLTGRDLRTPYRGVRIRSSETPNSPEAAIVADARQYAPRLASDHLYCSTTALAVYRVALPPRAAMFPLQVNAPLDRARPILPGVAAHRFSSVDRRDLDGLPVCAPEHAWAQSAQLLSLDELVIAGDALLRRVDPWCELDELRAIEERWRGRRGARRLTAAIVLLRPRTDSAAETRTRLLIVRAGLPEPEVNIPIVDEHGRTIAYGDLGYERWRILIEYDGEYHFETVEQARHDLDRIADLERRGWIVLRIHAGTLRDPDAFLEDLRRAIARRTGA